MRRSIAVALLAVAAAAAGCGKTEVVREKPVTVTQGEAAGSAAGTRPGGGTRIAVVTHGQASSPFWAIVRNGVEAAGRQMDAVVTYRAPDTYSVEKMAELVDDAIAAKPDGLVVSIPEPAVAPAVQRAIRAGLPVVSINSGSDVGLRLGVLAHVGQPEEGAGRGAGERLARAGVRRALCVNQQIGNVGLDARCRGLARAMRAAGGSSTVLSVDDQDPGTPARLAEAIDRRRIDGVLTLNSTAAALALEAKGKATRAGALQVATFDLGPEVLQALKAGKLLFAVDQQAYLQGYLPVVLLVQRARYGLFPAQGDVIPTGPNFVTKPDAGKVIALSERSIR